MAEEAQTRGEYLPLLLGKRHAAISRALIKPLWRGGYLVECGIAPKRAPTSVVEALLALPATRLLRELRTAIEGSSLALTRLVISP